jgi:hypothetical protein
MSETKEPPDTMSKPLTAAAQSAILSQFPWLPNGKVRVTCTHRTEHLLRKAGVAAPRPLEGYEVDVRRDEAGFLVINPYSSRPVAASDDVLFERGGIFADDQRGFIAPAKSRPGPPLAEIAHLGELPATRTFEIPTGPQSKIRVQVIAYEDESLPSPSERERWKPAKPSDSQLREAVTALHLSRRLADLEQL